MVRAPKQCNMCDEYKFADEFYKNKAKKDGLRGYCKECNKRRGKTYYLAKKDIK